MKNHKRWLALITLAYLSTYLFADKRDVKSHFGTIFISGSEKSNLVSISNEKGRFQLTSFDNWETIHDLYLSPDKTKLIVYHRPDKGSNRITLIDLKAMKIRASVAPGWALHKVFWFKNRILYETDTTGGGRQIRIFDDQLRQLGYFSGYELEMDLELGIAVSLPLYSPDGGIFKTFDLTDGSHISTFDFNQEMGEFYSVISVRNVVGRIYSFELQSEDLSSRKTFFRDLKSISGLKTD